MLDPRKVREALLKLTPEERADLEARLIDWYAETETWIESTATAHGQTFPVYSEVFSIPAPPGYTGPRVIRLRLEDEPDGGADER